MTGSGAYWRKLPLAVFPAILGFCGLSLMYRNAGATLGLPSEIGEVLSGAAFALLMFFSISYLFKLLARPSVMIEDLNSPPARAGLAAMPMSMMVSAAMLEGVVDFAPLLWMVGLVLLTMSALLVCYCIFAMGAAKHGMSAFLLLPFVGFIVAPIGGPNLGYAELSEWLAWASLLPFSIVFLDNIRHLTYARPPQPQRMSLVILLAPFSLFAQAFMQFGPLWLANLFAIGAVLAFVILLAFSRWLTEGGWTPVWASLTFPLAAFTNLVLLIASQKGGVATAIAYGLLGFTTIAILFAVYKSFKAWVRGDLSRMTFAAIA